MRKNDKKQTEPTFLKIIYFDELAAQDYLDITNGGRLDWSKEDNRKRAAEILTEIEAQAQGGFNILNFIKGSLAGNVDAKASGEVSKLFDSTIKNTLLSILVLCRTKDKSFDEVQSNYKISIKFKHEIELENNSYKKIRKLLEMAKKNMSLLMNEDGKIYAMGKMIDNPSCEYYEISFDGFFKWTLYKNKEKLLCYENMIPMIPDKEIGISNKNLELLKRTFDISDTSKFEKIIQKAVSQKHGTIVVFAENAMDEASRLEESGISITPIDISTGMLVEEITSIDGALICDVDGICYSIGTILDGIKSERTDSSRGARYNSAIRYIEKQKKNQKKTFIVVVSEDGYVNCFSSEE